MDNSRDARCNFCHECICDHAWDSTKVRKDFIHLCNRCPSMIRIKFASGAIPRTSVNLDAEYTSAVAITVCKTCDGAGRDPLSFGGGWGSNRINGCAIKFKDLGLDPSLMEGSKFMLSEDVCTSRRGRPS